MGHGLEDQGKIMLKLRKEWKDQWRSRVNGMLIRSTLPLIMDMAGEISLGTSAYLPTSEEIDVARLCLNKGAFLGQPLRN